MSRGDDKDCPDGERGSHGFLGLSAAGESHSGHIGKRSCVDSRQVLAVYQALRAKRLRGYAELDGLTLIIILGGIAACAFAVLAHVQADDRARARLAETQACACWEAEPITLGTTSDDGAAGLLLSPRAVSAAPSSDSLEVQP